MRSPRWPGTRTRRALTPTRCAPVARQRRAVSGGLERRALTQIRDGHRRLKAACSAAFGLPRRRGGDSNSRETKPPLTVFETAAFDRSATSPRGRHCNGGAPPRSSAVQGQLDVDQEVRSAKVRSRLDGSAARYRRTWNERLSTEARSPCKSGVTEFSHPYRPSHAHPHAKAPRRLRETCRRAPIWRCLIPAPRERLCLCPACDVAQTFRS
jgi:hypothetical protein